MTNNKNKPTLESDIEEVKQQFKAWRRTRKHYKPIPVELWDAAVKLCSKHPVKVVAKRLILNPTELKRRVHTSRTLPPDVDLLKKRDPSESTPPPDKKLKKRAPVSCTPPEEKPMPGPAFVELDLGLPQNKNPGCTITMEDQSGAKMQIHVDDARQLDIHGICKAFWSRTA